MGAVSAPPFGKSSYWGRAVWVGLFFLSFFSLILSLELDSFFFKQIFYSEFYSVEVKWL